MPYSSSELYSPLPACFPPRIFPHSLNIVRNAMSEVTGVPIERSVFMSYSFDLAPVVSATQGNLHAVRRLLSWGECLCCRASGHQGQSSIVCQCQLSKGHQGLISPLGGPYDKGINAIPLCWLNPIFVLALRCLELWCPRSHLSSHQSLPHTRRGHRCNLHQDLTCTSKIMLPELIRVPD